MMLKNVIEIRTAEPDSHFRLRTCKKCGGNNAAYVLKKKQAGEAWNVECFDCGNAGQDDQTRHGAQANWNETALEVVA